MIFTISYLFMVLIRPQEYVAAFQIFPIMPVLLLLAGCWWLMTKKLLDAPQFSLVLLFLVVTAFSRVANGWVGGGYDWLISFGPTCLMFYLVAASVRDVSSARWMMAAIVICAVVMALHGVDQVRNGVGWTGARTISGRITYLGMFNDPNDLGCFFVVALPMALYLAGSSGFLMKLMYYAAIPTLLYGILLTDSRGTMLATAAVVGLMVLRRYGAFLAGLATVPVLMGLMLLPSRLQEIDASEASAFGRVESWYVGMQLFKSHPLFGVGAGQFTQYHDLTAHNSYVLALAESGILGYSLFIALLGYGLLMMKRLGNYRAPPDSTPATQNELACVSIGRTLFYSLTGFCITIFFLSRTYNIVLYVLLGIISSAYIMARNEIPALPRYKLTEGWLQLGIITVVSVFALFIVVRVLLVMAA